MGKTTKNDVIEVFGAPNITTIDGAGLEVWSYQRSAQVAQSASQSGYFTILLAGVSGGTSGFESSSRMITLIIKFDKNGIVRDFRSRSYRSCDNISSGMGDKFFFRDLAKFIELINK